jgi:hypothetical protein
LREVLISFNTPALLTVTGSPSDDPPPRRPRRRRPRSARRRDGPFTKTREQLGGYFLIDAEDLDDAMDIAERIPGATKGTVEVRHGLELNGLPPT